MPPNDQMVEPELGDEDMTAWLSSLKEDAQLQLPQLELNPMAHQIVRGVTDEPDDDTEPDDAEEGDTDDDTNGDEPEGTPAPEEDFVTVNGNKIARADVQRLYEFDQFLRANPATAQRLAAALPEPTGESSVPGTGQTSTTTSEEFKEPQKPEWLDEEDPQQVTMWNMQVTAHRTAWETQQQVQKLNQTFLQQQQDQYQRQAETDMATALATFREQYPGLNEDDIKSIRQDAIPFVEGMMKQLPPQEALRRSMEVAAYANTDMRQKLEMTKPTATERQRSTRRKERLGALSSSPRSAPKEVTRPQFTSDRDMVNAIAHEISDQMGNQR